MGIEIGSPCVTDLLLVPDVHGNLDIIWQVEYIFPHTPYVLHIHENTTDAAEKPFVLFQFFRQLPKRDGEVNGFLQRVNGRGVVLYFQVQNLFCGNGAGDVVVNDLQKRHIIFRPKL